MAYVVVVNPDSSFSGGSPTGAKYITSISRTTSNALVTVTTSTSHGLTSGQSILITGAGAAFDGFFDIKPGSVTSNSFGYTYSHGPQTNLINASASTGAAYAPATLPFQVVPAQERQLTFSEYRTTPAIEGDIAISPTGGLSRVNNVLTVTTTEAHNLQVDDTVMLADVHSTGSSVAGIFTVETVPTVTSFTVYQYGDDTTGTGGIVYDFGFEDYIAGSDIDILTDTQRLKLSSLGSFYPDTGYIILKKDSMAHGTSWGFCSYDADLPAGTSVTIQARVSDDDTLFDTMGDDSWGDPISAGSSIDLIGQYLELKVTLSTANISVTPVLRGLHLAFAVPGNVGGVKTQSWQPLDASTQFLTLKSQTQFVTYEGTGAVALGVQATTPTYADSGSIIIQMDTNGLNDWVQVEFDADIPYSTEDSKPTIAVQSRFFNRMRNRDATAWSTATNFTNSDATHIVTTTQTAKRVGEFKFTLTPSTTKSLTPNLHSIRVKWTKVVEGQTGYVYTTTLKLPSNLSSIILTPNAEEPDGCEIVYGINFTNKVDFENHYEVIVPNTLYTPVNRTGSDVRVGVKMLSGSTSGVPKIHELGIEVNTEGHEVFYPNATYDS